MDQIFALLADPKVLALLSPLLVSALKRLVTSLPSWSLPILSVLLGAGVAAVSGGDLANGAVGGAMGIGIREIIDQGFKAAKPTPSA